MATLTRFQRFVQSPKLVWSALGAIAVADIVYLFIMLMQRFYPCDFEVYRLAGQSILDQQNIYETVTSGCRLRFTYTPFAAVLFVWVVPFGSAAFWLWTVFSLVALARSCVLLVRALSRQPEFPSATQLAIALFLFLLPLEPVLKTLWYGQINLVLLWLILESFLGTSRLYSGVFSAVATAIKLTPGLFLVFFVTLRAWRDRVVVVLTLVASVLVGFLVQPEASRSYWSGLLFKMDRVGPIEYVYNQSANGFLWRVIGPGGSQAVWIGVVATLLLLAFIFVLRLYTAGETLWALSLIAAVTVLVSPISWSHHYVVVALWLAAMFGDVVKMRIHWAWLAFMYLLFLAATPIFKLIPHTKHAEFSLHGWQWLMANQYVFVAIAIIALAVRRTNR